MSENEVPKHPAKFHDKAIMYADRILKDATVIIDPFAGVGRVHELARGDRFTWGVEIEEEWAEARPGTIHGDSTMLTEYFDEDTFDGVFTSPTYGNRMADHFNAKDSSHRITYKHYLGHDLDPNNSGRMKWGQDYRDLHEEVYWQLGFVCQIGAIGVFNIKNSLKTVKKIRGEIPVVEWHIYALSQVGWRLRNTIRLNTPGMRRGENHEARVDADLLIVMELTEKPPA